MGLCDRGEGRVCAKEGEGLPTVKGGKRGGERVYQRAIMERIYLTVKITTDSASILCRKKGWEEVDGTGLPIFE